jgi:glycolate oxidase iron-sulfur subunit
LVAGRSQLLDYEATLDCIHCGLCLPVCPTYQETGNEASSPRGRIYTMRGVAEGRIELDRAVADEMHFCLACRACESACPAGVRYGHLVETMRAEIDAVGARPRRARFVERLLLRHVIGRRTALRAAVALLRTYQTSGLQRAVRRSRALQLWPALQRAEQALPHLGEPHRPPILVPAQGKRRGRVAFFAGCVMPEVFGAVNEATVAVLARNGFEVRVPPRQVCCGALQLHSGDPEGAERLRQRNRRVFHPDSIDALVVNSAGCAASLKEAGDGLAPLVRDVTEFLWNAGLREPDHPVPLRVAYDDPCHLLHGQGIGEAPRRLLRSIPRLELFDLPGCRDCCGAAGIYGITHPELSGRLAARKVDAVRQTRPDAVATGNPGCMLQIDAALRDAGLEVAVLHPVELLAAGYGLRSRPLQRLARAAETAASAASAS